VTASVNINFKFEFDIPGTEPSNGTVRFRGQVTNSTGDVGDSSFDQVDEWEASPLAQNAIASTDLDDLRTGQWRIEASTPLSVTSCEVTLRAGANDNVNFLNAANGCARGFGFPGSWANS
jgi:hypothetical protein